MVMYLNGKAYSSHSQLIGAFNKELVANAALPKSVGKALRLLFDLRQTADYDFYQRADQQELCGHSIPLGFILKTAVDSP
jgi:uncharacterized protein (UPF0332 family)